MSRYFYELTPERVLDAVEASGLRCTGSCQALNSFENRVYDVELEDGERRVAKFYRPGRWSVEQVLEEHRFLADVAADEIPVVAPIAFADGKTLHESPGTGILYALFPKVAGRAPDELTDGQLEQVGRLLARIHVAGVAREAPHRIRLDGTTYGRASLETLAPIIPPDFFARYRTALERVLAISEPWLAETPIQRIHGDCHLGNLLWNREGFYFLDFDDMVRGCAVQDVWLLTPGRDEEALRQRDKLLDGYEQLRAFDRSSLRLVEALRALRFAHYSAWIARRWADPAFPRAFPEFGTHRYWADETADLEEQARRLEIVAASRSTVW